MSRVIFDEDDEEATPSGAAANLLRKLVVAIDELDLKPVADMKCDDDTARHLTALENAHHNAAEWLKENE